MNVPQVPSVSLCAFIKLLCSAANKITIGAQYSPLSCQRYTFKSWDKKSWLVSRETQGSSIDTVTCTYFLKKELYE